MFIKKYILNVHFSRKLISSTIGNLVISLTVLKKNLFVSEETNLLKKHQYLLQKLVVNLRLALSKNDVIHRQLQKVHL